MKPMTTMSCRATTALLFWATLLALLTPTLACADTPAASVWSRMWRTPDQHGQALLQQGDAAGAAQAFTDPEHKAHAALQAGDYTGAAQTLSNINTAEAQYNRGNALAHAGDLQGAIKAYDAALKQSPQHADARHNRDVVAAALQKQKDDKKDNSSQQDKQSKDDGKPGDKTGDKQKRQDGKDGKDGEPKDSKAADKPGEKPNEKSESKPGEKTGKDAPAKPGEQPASAPQPGKASAAAPAAPATPASAAKDDATQARRDAESALGKGAQLPTAPAQGGASIPAQAKAGANDAIKLQSPTERQIAQEQWLRAIPDDPGGLLRRKFLIEHMLRQQGQKP
nr:tetratricopeptide repeat protein [Rhodoferax sp.]